MRMICVHVENRSEAIKIANDPFTIKYLSLVCFRLGGTHTHTHKHIYRERDTVIMLVYECESDVRMNKLELCFLLDEAFSFQLAKQFWAIFFCFVGESAHSPGTVPGTAFLAAVALGSTPRLSMLSISSLRACSFKN